TLVEERDRQLADAVGDDDLHHLALAVAHVDEVDLGDLRHDGDVLIDPQLAERREHAPLDVAPRVVAEQVAAGAELETLVERLRQPRHPPQGQRVHQLPEGRQGHPLTAEIRTARPPTAAIASVTVRASCADTRPDSHPPSTDPANRHAMSTTAWVRDQCGGP